MSGLPDDASLPWIAGPARDIAARQRGHALLLQGHAGAGVFELALRLARTWLCEGEAPPCGRCAACHLLATNSHPDLRALLPELTQVELGWSVGGEAVDDGEGGKAKRKPSREIRIDAVRDAIDWTQTSSSRGRGKVLLLFPADAMNLVAANALLKTLEEPPSGVRVLLVAEDAERLLPTLRSRCQRLLFAGPAPDEALAWLQAQKPWIVPIPGTTKLHRLEENIASTELGLNPAELAEIERALAGVEMQGDRYPPENKAMAGR